MNADSRRSRRPKRSLKTTLVVIGALVGYALLQPSLEQWLGVDLPSLTDDQQQVAAPSEPSAQGDRGVPPASEQGERAPTGPESQAEKASAAPAASASSTAKERPPSSTENGRRSAKTAKTTTPRLGELRDLGGKVFQSTAGLRYRPGSQEGHRIKHVLRHHEDDPDRPVPGVFDGDRNEVFAVIDEAYLYTFDHGPPRVTKEEDDGRTVYVVDLGRRIGYVGGRKGRRNGRPAADHLQLVLDGANVVTAYPVRVGRRP